MEGSLHLNDYNVRENCAAGSHDPGMMFDPVSQKYYSYSTDVYGKMIGVEDLIGIPVRSSRDLVHFTYHGSVLSPKAITQARDNGSYRPTVNFWAPYCEYADGEYRLYYSATRAFGSSESRIWLATAKDPLGPFENRGVVVDSWGTSNAFPNAIDPHIIRDGGDVYLVYGSFFGGIHIKALDPATGLSADGNPKNLGKCIARKSKKPKLDGPEGPAIDYNPETGYFYLFLSYGWLGDTYDIRVGRSKSVTGPYLDRQGRDLVGNALGEKLAGSYRFEAKAPQAGTDIAGWQWGGFRGPGHGVPFFDPKRRAWFFVHHVRDGAKVCETKDRWEKRLSFNRHYLMIRPMYFLEDGWPVLGPEPFGGESVKPLDIPAPAGLWEILLHTDNNNNQKASTRMALSADSPYLTRGRLHRSTDFENGGTCLTVTGTTPDGIAYWGKLIK